MTRATRSRTVRTRPPTVDRGAVRDVAPMAAAVIPLGVVVGVTIVALGVPRWIGFASSPLLYSGSAQLTYLTMARADAGLLTVIGTLLMTNARMLIYSSGLAPYFERQPAWFRWLTPTFIVDQTFVVVAGREDLRDPQRFRRYWLTAGTTLGLVWVLAIITGVFAGPFLPAGLRLDVAAPALFIGLLVPRIVDRTALAVTALAGLVAAVAYGPLGALALPVAMLCGLLAVVATTQRRMRSKETG